MHLDCVFSILSDDCCIMLEDIIGEASPTRRLVDEWEINPATGEKGFSTQRRNCS
jgi:arginine deiminase